MPTLTMAYLINSIAVSLNAFGLIFALAIGFFVSQADTSLEEQRHAILVACGIAALVSVNLFMLISEWKFSAASRAFVIANNFILAVWVGRDIWEASVHRGSITNLIGPTIFFVFVISTIVAILLQLNSPFSLESPRRQ